MTMARTVKVVRATGRGGLPRRVMAKARAGVRQAAKLAKARAKREMKATANSLRNSQEYVELLRGARTVFRIYKHNSM